MPHIVLLGDSIFDNGAYVPGDPDVVAQLRRILPAGWEASLLAVDGAIVDNVLEQIKRIPESSTHLAVSAGGNDALGNAHLLSAPASSVSAALTMLGQAQSRFAKDYARLAERLAATKLPVSLCTIYDTPASAPGQPLIRIALSLFNDVISRAAFMHGFSLLDLRLICDRDDDYANPIEPSAQGGEKIASAISAFATAEPNITRVSRVFI